jgi:hypothetical protein
VSATTLTFDVPGVSVSSLTLDATTSLNHSGDVDVTEHPVEDGGNISDGARPKQAVLSVEGIFSDNPLSLPPGAPGTGAGRAKEAYANLKRVKDAGGVVSITTGLEAYANMIIKKLSTPETSKMGRSVKFSMELTQVRLVRSQTVAIRKVKTPKAQPKQNDGKKNPVKTPPAVVAKSIWKGSADNGIIKSASDALSKAFGG